MNIRAFIRSKWIIITLVILVIAVLIGGYGIFKKWESEKLRTPRPYIPKEGEQIVLVVYTIYKGKGTYVGGVKISLTEIDTRSSQTQITNANGKAHFPVIVGNTYIINATFEGATSSITHEIRPLDYIIVCVSEDNKIDSIIPSEWGIQ